MVGLFSADALPPGATTPPGTSGHFGTLSTTEALVAFGQPADTGFMNLPQRRSLRPLVLSGGNTTRATAAEISAGRYVGLNCSGENWFRVNVEGSLEVEIIFRHSDGDLDLYLLNADGLELDRSEGTSDNETISKRGLPQGEYYIKVFGYNGARGAYTMTVNDHRRLLLAVVHWW
jgi:hypothetical protein